MPMATAWNPGNYWEAHLLMPEAKKRVFVGLISVSLVLLAMLAGIGWYLVQTGSRAAWWVLLIILSAVIGFLIYAGLGILGLLVSLMTGRTVPVLSRAQDTVAFALLPVALWVGGLLGVDKDRIRASFIEVNNQLFRQKDKRVRPKELLILAPICLQNADCPRKVTNDIHQCRRCGRCPVGGLLELADKYGVNLAVATGGTKARQLIRDLRPQVVIAIACERDLVSGLQDARQITVGAITNERPQGPCLNTQVDLDRVEKALQASLLDASEQRG